MDIFKKTIKYSKPSIEIDNKIKDLNEGLKKTKSTLSEQKFSEEEVDKLLIEQIVDVENWKEIFDESTVSEYEKQIDEIRDRHNDLIKVQGSIEHVKNKEVKEIFSELYQGEVERVVDTYVSKYSNDIINLREDLFHEIKKEPVVDLRVLEEKINLLTLKYNQLSEGLLNEPSTGLEESVTFEHLKNHYQLLVGRLQEQLATLGGGGEVRLQYLDDIVGIATNAVAYDGKFLKYNHSLKKFEFVTVTGGSGIGLTDLSVTTNSAGTAALSYNNNGVFTYTPPSFVGYATEGYVNSAVVGFITTGALSGYATEGYVNSAVVGFITTGALSGYATEGYVNSAVAGVVTFSGNYNDLSNKPTIPTNLGDLTNNVGFITTGASGAGLKSLTGASAGTYGNATNSAQITVDANGRIAGIAQIGISGGGGGGISGINIFNSGTSVGLTTNLEFRNNITAVSSGSTIYVDASGISTANINADTLNVSGIATATSFSGSGIGLTSIPAGQLTGNLPAIDGSALLNVNASRTTVSASTGSIANNAVGLVTVTGFKSYALMKVGLSTEGWIRIYTDSASRTADSSRSVGIDPAPGSGVIAEVVTTGISTEQKISPFTMGGNMDDPVDTTIYMSITNLSGSTQSINANLTILQLEA